MSDVCPADASDVLLLKSWRSRCLSLAQPRFGLAASLFVRIPSSVLRSFAACRLSRSANTLWTPRSYRPSFSCCFSPLQPRRFPCPRSMMLRLGLDVPSAASAAAPAAAPAAASPMSAAASASASLSSTVPTPTHLQPSKLKSSRSGICCRCRISAHSLPLPLFGFFPPPPLLSLLLALASWPLSSSSAAAAASSASTPLLYASCLDACGSCWSTRRRNAYEVPWTRALPVRAVGGRVHEVPPSQCGSVSPFLRTRLHIQSPTLAPRPFSSHSDICIDSIAVLSHATIVAASARSISTQSRDRFVS